MPANMISAPVGSSPAVAGSRRAMVSAGPTPGSTPIAVPSVTPRKPHIRFFHVSATAKPDINALKVSIVSALAAGERTLGQAQTQGQREDEEHHDGENDGDDCVPRDAPAAEAACDED